MNYLKKYYPDSNGEMITHEDGDYYNCHEVNGILSKAVIIMELSLKTDSDQNKTLSEVIRLIMVGSLSD